MGERSAPTLAIEFLESRLNLSTLNSIIPSAPAVAGGSSVQDVTTLTTTRRYRIEAWNEAAATTTYGKTWTNPTFGDAQAFFDLFKNRFGPYVPPEPSPTPDPAPTPDPTPTPPPAPTPSPTGNTDPVTITQKAEGNFTRLVITGTTGNDSIVVSQSGNTLTITANGHSDSVTGSFAEIAIYGAAGNDIITVQSSVNIASLIYGGSGTNTLAARGSAKSYIVALGDGVDTLSGNGINTSFWADTTDTVNATGTESSKGGVHKISSFYQPWTTNNGSADYISTSLSGQNLRDPTDSGTTTNYSSRSLWGTGPTYWDVNQGQVGDCYFLASIQSFAYATPNKLMEMAVDLGDGTYAVEFHRNYGTQVVRVDADLPSTAWGGLLYASPKGGGGIWASIMEKAYAYFRTGANTYSSLNFGWTGYVYSDFGVWNTTFGTSGDANAMFSQITTALNSNIAVSVCSRSTIASGIPIIGSHAYSILDTSIDANGTKWITVRNPWGVDGAGSDANTNDGILKITLSQFISAYTAGTIGA